MKYKTIIIIFALLISEASLANTSKNSIIRVAGSSTVYPFVTLAAEEFGYKSGYRTPVVESNGTGGGMSLFCAGNGKNYPDFVNASRMIKESEIMKCYKNNIKSIDYIKLGYDGIVIAQSVDNNIRNLSRKEVFLSLAEKIPHKGRLIDNPYKRWSDINPSLPNSKIYIYGPPSSSGTRDSFVEILMELVCLNIKEYIDLYPDKKDRKKACHRIRTDHIFVEVGENDNMIIQKLQNNKTALGILGFSFLDANFSTIKAVKIDNIYPTHKAISDKEYLISRPLLVYFKSDRAKNSTAMKYFVRELIDLNTIGEHGYLSEIGLVPDQEGKIKEMQERISNILE